MLYFRKYPHAYLEVETYQLPTDGELAEPEEPSVMYIGKIVFKQEITDKQLTELVDDTFTAMEWKSSTPEIRG